MSEWFQDLLMFVGIVVLVAVATEARWPPRDPPPPGDADPHDHRLPPMM